MAALGFFILFVLAMLFGAGAWGAPQGEHRAALRHCQAQGAHEYTIAESGEIVCVKVTKEAIRE